MLHAQPHWLSNELYLHPACMCVLPCRAPTHTTAPLAVLGVCWRRSSSPHSQSYPLYSCAPPNPTLTPIKRTYYSLHACATVVFRSLPMCGCNSGIADCWVQDNGGAANNVIHRRQLKRSNCTPQGKAPRQTIYSSPAIIHKFPSLHNTPTQQAQHSDQITKTNV